MNGVSGVSVESMQDTFMGESTLILVQVVKMENRNEELFGSNTAIRYFIFTGTSGSGTSTLIKCLSVDSDRGRSFKSQGYLPNSLPQPSPLT